MPPDIRHCPALLVSASTLGLALSVVPWSVAGDRWGRRRAMVVSMVSASALSSHLAARWDHNLGQGTSR